MGETDHDHPWTLVPVSELEDLVRTGMSDALLNSAGTPDLKLQADGTENLRMYHHAQPKLSQRDISPRCDRRIHNVYKDEAEADNLSEYALSSHRNGKQWHPAEKKDQHPESSTCPAVKLPLKNSDLTSSLDWAELQPAAIPSPESWLPPTLPQRTQKAEKL